MKKLLIILLCITMLLSFIACNEKNNDSSSKDAARAVSPAGNNAGSSLLLLPEGGWVNLPDGLKNDAAKTGTQNHTPGTLQLKYVPKYAKGFHVEYYYGGGRIIETHIEATQNTAAVSQRVLVLPEGAVEPVNTTWQHKIEGYAKNVVTFASSHAGHLQRGLEMQTRMLYI